MKKRILQKFANNSLQYLSIICFVSSLIYIPIRTLLDEKFRADGNFRLMLVQCSLGLFAACIPLFLPYTLKRQLPKIFSFSLCSFLIASIFFGDVVGFYKMIPSYDSYLHFISGVLLFACSISIAKGLFGKNTIFSYALFSISFALAGGCVWEIYEFVFDRILGLNMQCHSSALDGSLVPKIGQNALLDTMKDLILDLVGALFACAIYAIAKSNIAPGRKGKCRKDCLLSDTDCKNTTTPDQKVDK